MTKHSWVTSTVGHGVLQCQWCGCTEREATYALGMECIAAPKEPERVQLSQQTIDRAVTALRNLTQHVGSMRTPQNIADAGIQIMLTLGPAYTAAVEVLDDLDKELGK